MKKIIILLFFTTICAYPCFSQQSQPIKIIYKVKAPNLIYELKLDHGNLEISENGSEKDMVLTKSQLGNVDKYLSTIDLHNIPSNINLDDLATNKSIKAACIIFYHEKMHAYQIDHKNPPKEIKGLFQALGLDGNGLQ